MPPTSTPDVDDEPPALAIQTYAHQLAGVRARPEVQLSIISDPSLDREPVLLVSYPSPSQDPASRDVWCDAENSDWSGGRAISFMVKPEHALKFSLSFFDRNRVVYTKWIDLDAGVWQAIRVPFDDIQPNPYFQPPDAKLGGPIDVSAVKGIAFATQDPTPGHLSISKFVVVR